MKLINMSHSCSPQDRLETKSLTTHSDILLPRELLSVIFSFLNLETLKIVRSISHDWKAEADRYFWKKSKLVVSGENCWEIIRSKKLNIVSALDIRMSLQYNKKDLTFLFRNILSSSSLTTMRIYEQYFISTIPKWEFCQTILSVKYVYFFFHIYFNRPPFIKISNQCYRILQDIFKATTHQSLELQTNFCSFRYIIRERDVIKNIIIFSS